jgi:hypothetical protein
MLLVLLVVAFIVEEVPSQEQALTRAGKLPGVDLALTGMTGLAVDDVCCESPDPVLALTGMIGLAVDEPDLLLVAIPLQNVGTASATNVEVFSLTLESSSLLSTTTLPIALGALNPGDIGVIHAQFSSANLVVGTQYRLTAEGISISRGTPLRFAVTQLVTLPKPAPGFEPLQPATVAPNQVQGAPFPPDIIPEELEGINPPGSPVPIGPSRFFFPPPPTGTTPDAAQFGSAAAVQFTTDSPFGTTGGTPPDMSGAKGARNVVLTTGNTYASLSTDGGAMFTQLDPTVIFPNRDSSNNLIDGGLCCDQVVQYIPSIDRFVWLMQFRRATLPTDTPCPCPPGTGSTGPNRLRLAAASPADMITSGGTAWTYWDLTSATFNLGNNWMDYPDLAVGDNFLYVSVDVVGTGLFVMRIPLTEIRDSLTINIDYTDSADGVVSYGSHLVQNSGDGGFWAGHNSTSQMRVFSMLEGDDSYSWHDVNVDSWSNSDITSTTPTTPAVIDWLTASSGFPLKPRNSILGGARKPVPDGADELWLGWTAGRDSGAGRPHPYIRIARIDVSILRSCRDLVCADAYTGIYDIWNPDFAFAYPALATNSEGEVGVSLGWGGNTDFANHAAGFLGDFVVYYTALSDAAISRWGDYVSIRRSGEQGNEFAATGYQVRLNNPAEPTDCSGAAGCSFTPRFEVFRRPPIILR